MRILRITSLILLIASLLFSFWENGRYYASLNRDYPVIRCEEEELSLSVEEGDDALFRGLSATDETSGDLTDRIMVSSVSHFLEPGLVKVSYVVFDDHNNSATFERNVRYTDYTPPRFSLKSAPVYTLGKGYDLMDDVRAEDPLDGDVTDKVRLLSSTVSSFSPGTYPVVLEVSNSCGATSQITLYVTYQSAADTAQIRLFDYICYVEQGEEFDPDAMVAGVFDSAGTALDREKITVQGVLDPQKPGCYQLSYHYNSQGLKGSAPLTVVVQEGGGHGE